VVRVRNSECVSAGVLSARLPYLHDWLCYSTAQSIESRFILGTEQNGTVTAVKTFDLMLEEFMELYSRLTLNGAFIQNTVNF
jgi:hypothetical protein